MEGPALLDAEEDARSHRSRGQDLLGGHADPGVVVQLSTTLHHMAIIMRWWTRALLEEASWPMKEQDLKMKMKRVVVVP